MDAKLFSKMIMELLSSDGRVVLDGFGTFVTEIVPAHFSDKGFTLNPPYLKVCFYMGDDSSDSLARLYSSSNNVDLSRAKAVTADFVALIRREITNSKSFALPGLGTLRAMSRENVFFIPQEGLELFPGYDCLEPVSLKSISVDTSYAVPAYDEPQQATVSEGKDATPSKVSFPVWMILMGVVVLALVLLAALAIVGRLCPDLVDPILYSPEELKILRYKF